MSPIGPATRNGTRQPHWFMASELSVVVRMTTRPAAPT